MSRTVTALFDGRPEAEAARARLASQVEVESTRILAKDTAAAVDDLKLEPNQSKSYREALLGGDYLLVAQVARGEKPSLIVDLLSGSAAPVPATTEAAEPLQSFEVRSDEEATAEDAPDDVVVVEEEEEDARVAEVPVPPTTTAASEAPAPIAESRISPSVEHNAAETEASETPVRDAQTAEPGALRIGEPQLARGGARVRSMTREEPAEQQIALNEERVELENRPVERRLSDEDVEAGGLLKNRIFEVVEMREEPVIAKELVVREEVIVRKTRHERMETVRDTVRRTEVEVEELPSS